MSNPQLYKWTYLAGLVELSGTVRDSPGPSGPEFSPIEFNLAVDSNFSHLVENVRGCLMMDPLYNGEPLVGKVHCETYPIEPEAGGSVDTNRYEPWALPDAPADPLMGKVWDFSSSPPASRNLQPGDHILLRGQLRIENGHPIDSHGTPQGTGGDGWVFIELHPFDFRNVRLVGPEQPQVRRTPPTMLARANLVIMAPVYEYVTQHGKEWPGSEVIQVGDGGQWFHNSLDAVFSVGLMSGPGKPQGDVYYRETVVENGTGKPLDQIRTIDRDTGWPAGLIVRPIISAPQVTAYEGIDIADVNDPANDRSILVAEYHVASTPLTGGLLRHTVRAANDTWQPVGDVNAQISAPGWTVLDGAQNIHGQLGGGPSYVIAVGAASPTTSLAQFMMATDSGRLWISARDANGEWSKTGAGSGNVPLAYFGPVAAIAGVATGPAITQWLFATDDGHLWHTVFDLGGSPMDNGGSTWQPVGDATAATEIQGRVVGVAAVSADQGEAQFMMVTDDGHLWHSIRHADESWQPVEDVTAKINGPAEGVAAVTGVSSNPGEIQFLFAT